MSSVDQDTLMAFIAEAGELLDTLEPMLIELQENAEQCGGIDLETINSIFRPFHTIKGNAGFMELNAVSKVTHEAETLLDIFRKEKAELKSEHTELFCQTCDFLRSAFEHIEEELNDEAFLNEAGELQKILNSAIVKIESGDAQKSAVDEVKIEITPEMIQNYISEARELAKKIEEEFLVLNNQPENKESIESAFRAIHSLKGNSGLVSFHDIEKLAHQIEAVLEALRSGEIKCESSTLNMILSALDVIKSSIEQVEESGDGTIDNVEIIMEILSEALPDETCKESQNDKSELINKSEEKVSQKEPKPAQKQIKHEVKKRRDIRVDLSKLDNLVNLVGELLIADAMVSQNPNIAMLEDPNFNRATHYLHRIISDLQDVSMGLRMVPVEGVFKKMIRVVHDLSRKAGKKIKLELEGENTEVDRSVLDQLGDPLVHMVRNAADHGIENMNDRLAAGKPEGGKILLKAEQKANFIYIVISDDGRGLDREKILAKAIEKGVVDDSGENLTDSEVFQLIFAPGFSTAEKVTDVSGRGVGMDVVKKNIESIKGKVSIESTLGEGSKFIIQIPLTLATLEGMLVEVGGQKFTLPINSIRESLRPVAKNINVRPDGQEFMKIREEIVPVMRLHKIYGITPRHQHLSEGVVLIMENENRVFGLFVDKILYQHETVIKELTGHASGVISLSGCSILGNGEIALIIDVDGLLKQIKTNPEKMEAKV